MSQAAADNVTHLKMVEYGMEKQAIAMTTPMLLPLAMATPLLTAKLLPRAHPLAVFLGSFVLRLLVNLADPIILLSARPLRHPPRPAADICR